VAGLAIVVAFLALAAPASAEEAEPWSYQVWRETMSPFCPGRALSDCPSEQAESLRMWVLTQEEEGRSRADVEAEIVGRYGDIVLAAPRAKGFGLTAYLIPAAAFVGGGLLVGTFLHRQTRRRQGTPLPSAEPGDAELERLVDDEFVQ
jgi:cytochrome c-type biogenesis protein CcmH